MDAARGARTAAGLLTVLLIGQAMAPAGGRAHAAEWRAGGAEPGIEGDLDCDGWRDMVFATPRGVVGGAQGGSVTVVYQRWSAGERSYRARLYSQASEGVPGDPEQGEWFGGAIAVGDFDGDACSDLAIGVPGQRVAGQRGAGAVQVIPGAPRGLDAARTRTYTQDGAVPGDPAADASFGVELAAGDFDGDGDEDLAIAASTARVGAMTGAGAVVVLNGGPAGLTATGARLVHQDSAGIPSRALPNERFGYSLAAGDLNMDGRDDLAVGAPADIVGAVIAGSVTTIHGSRSGLLMSTARLWSEDTTGVIGRSESADDFGVDLVIANVGRTAADDLVIGSGEGVGAARGAGAVHVLPGSAGGATARGDQYLDGGSFAFGAAQADADFGGSLTAGDFDGDGWSDIAVGAPYASVGGAADAGMVVLVPGSYQGLVPTDAMPLTEDTTGVAGTASADEAFGRALAAGDFDGNGAADLLVGAPYEDVRGLSNAGVAYELWGRRGVGVTGRSRMWSPETKDVPGVTVDCAYFSARIS